MTVLPGLVLIAALGQTPADPAELAKAQSALESYLTRIRSLQVTYDESWTPPNPAAYQRKNPDWDPALKTSHELLYAFPSLRMTTVEPYWKVEEGQKQRAERKTTTSLHKGKLYSIVERTKVFNVRSSIDPLHFPFLPLHPVGLRVISTMNTPISEFLKFPAITLSKGEDKIDGERVVLFQIGPMIPRSARPATWSDAAVLKLWLAPDRSYLPLRSELLHANDSKSTDIYKMSLGSFKAVEDSTRRTIISFPQHMEIEYPIGGKSSYAIQSVVVNPSVSERDFMLSPPSSYSIAIDGEIRSLSGGSAVRDQRVEDSVEEAKRLLSSVTPPKSSASRWSIWSIGVAVVAAVVLGAILVFKWRIGT